MQFYLASKNGKAGRRYLVGSNNELTNKELVEIICGNLDMIKPQNLIVQILFS